MKSINYIQTAVTAFLVIFNAGIVLKLAQIILEGMVGEPEDTKKKISNYVKALVIVNSIVAIISLVKKYYR